MRIYANQEYLLGNATLHLQLSTALAVLTQLICNSNRPPSAAQLSEQLEVSVKYLRKLLRLLAGGGLVAPHAQLADTWICTRPPHAVSLADVYRSLAGDEPEGPSRSSAGSSPTGPEILMMQATVTVNQLVLQQLQSFDLGRLKIAESALLFTTALREKAQRVQEAPAPFRPADACT